jgi:hypothetical protein
MFDNLLKQIKMLERANTSVSLSLDEEGYYDRECPNEECRTLQTAEYLLAEPVVKKDYEFTIDQCDVVDKRALAAFRDKRRTWLIWLETDEHHAIWQVLSTMVWRDVVFRTIAEVANADPESGLHNPLLTEALLSGYFSTQVLAIRRLMDNASNHVISLPRLLKDLRRNLKLFTRENVVCFDGLPYDHEEAQQRVMLAQIRQGGGAFWVAQTGPDAYFPAQQAHQQLDQLSGTLAANRRRNNHLPARIIDQLEWWLDESGAVEIVKWSHTLLAHAAGPTSPNRSAIAAAAPTANKITACIRSFVRVAEAVTNSILLHSGRGMLVPVPQFNPFEKLDHALAQFNDRVVLDGHWDRLAKERNDYLEGIEAALVAETHRAGEAG